jgi:hypothetical protein
MKRVLVGTLLLMVAASSNALTVKDYKEAKRIGGQAWESVRYFVSGIRDGIQGANAWLMVNHQPVMYCQPPHLALNADNITRIVDDAIEKWSGKPEMDSFEIDAVVVDGLIRMFPCPNAGAASR